MPSKGPPACLGWVSPLPLVAHTLGRASCPLGDQGTELQLFHTDLQVNRVNSGSSPFSAGSRKCGMWWWGGCKNPFLLALVERTWVTRSSFSSLKFLPGDSLWALEGSMVPEGASFVAQR